MLCDERGVDWVFLRFRKLERRSDRSNKRQATSDKKNVSLSCRMSHVACRNVHSHSIVAGGFEETSYTTLFTPLTSLMIRLEIRSSTSGGSLAQSAVIA